MAAVFFDHTQFVNAHGHAPRGRGGWAFEFVVDGEKVADPDQDPAWGDLALVWWVPDGSCLFSEAKKWARAKARELGASRILVCS